MDIVEAGAASVAEGLEQLRSAQRLHVSRTLHDEIGPSLCSAGLMLGLVRDSVSALDEANSDLLDSVQQALESAIHCVRTLSYAAEPNLAGRCGFRPALTHIAASNRAELHFAPGARDLSGVASDAVCRILQDALIALPRTTGGRIECSTGRITLSASGRIPAAPLSALDHLAATAGLSLTCVESSGTTTLTLSYSEEA